LPQSPVTLRDTAEVPVILLTMMAAAIAAPAPAASPPRTVPKGAEVRACDAGPANEVVVCARREADEPYRLKPIEDARFAPRPVRAEANIPGGGKIKAHGEQGSVGGFTSPRAMVTLSWPF
jgi:hypothetical protein